MVREHTLAIQAKYANLIPHEKDVEGRVCLGVAAKVRQGDGLKLGSVRVAVLQVG